MNELIVKFDHSLCDEEKRMISFVSDDIVSYKVTGKIVKVMLKDNCIKNDVENRLKKLVQLQHEKIENKIIYSNYTEKQYISDEEIYKSGIIKKESDGCISLSELGLKLFYFFDQYFLSVLDQQKVIIKQFPTLLNMDTIENTNYISTSPQYVIYCSRVKESLSEYEDFQNKYKQKKIQNSLEYPHYALSPSACFHLYQSIFNEVLKEETIFSMRQNVFRNEGRFNWDEIGRLQDYHVREIVMIGNHNFVLNKREELLKKSIQLLDELKINYTIEIASDPFVMPVMQKYAHLQLASRVKYEMRLNIDPQNTIACASYNIHGKAFSSKFHFSVKNCENTESGCIGFGIERLVIAFLKQYGVEQTNWPKIIIDYIK